MTALVLALALVVGAHGASLAAPAQTRFNSLDEAVDAFIGALRAGDRAALDNQHFGSRAGRRDGLYWQTRPDEAPSPLGPLVARARQEGYGRPGQGPSTYHGYRYRILTSQGPDAAMTRFNPDRTWRRVEPR